MNTNLYMFGVLLLLMTLISSFGGAIRTEENFYNEVFDLLDNDKVELVEGTDEKDLATDSMELEGVDENMPTEAPVPEPKSEPEYKLEVAEEFDEPNINPYDSPQYARF